MAVSELGVFASPSLPNVVATDVDVRSPISRDYESAARDKWQQVIDYQLIEWGSDPSQLEDGETPPPSGATIHLAVRVAEALRNGGDPAPTRTVPDAIGGIVFEREAGNVFESVRVSADGSVEYCEFENCRLVQRQPWA